MSGRLITAKIDVKKIDKEKLFEGYKGVYLDLVIWVNDSADQYGNEVSIEQKTAKGEDKIFLGNGKFYKPQTAPVQTAPPSEPQRITAKDEDPGGLPF